MFGNLKNKLGDGADLKKFSSPQILSSLTSSRQRSNQHTPGSETPNISRHSRQPSDVSLPSVTSTPINGDKRGKDQRELSSTNCLSKGSSKYEKEVEKLKLTLESQNKTAAQKLNEKEKEWKSILEEEHMKISVLEKELEKAKARESNLNNTLRQKEEETIASNDVAVTSKAKYEAAEKKLVCLQEDYDELEGLSAQEVAKTKHLLLNTTAELEKAKSELKEKTREISELQRRISNYEGIEDRIRSFNDEKMDLETKMAGLSHKLNSANAKLTSQSEQHEEEINHLKDKLAMVNRRQSQTSLDEQEKNESFNKERVMYEHKLEEARQQLNNIKTSWSEKISSLETQIQHLNNKMAEDQVDYKSLEATNESLKNRVLKMQSELDSKQQNLAKDTDTLQEKLNRVTEDLETAHWQLQTETEKRDEEIKGLQSLLNDVQEKLNRTAEDLSNKETLNSNLSMQLDELKSKVESLEIERYRLEAKCTTASNSTNTLQERLNQETTTVASLEQELSSLKKRNDVITSEKNKLANNLDKISERLEESESLIEALNKDNGALNKRIAHLDNREAELLEENSSLLRAADEMNQDFNLKVESSELVKDLKQKLKTAEDEIMEKKQMLKVSSQRLADMKKAFQKEMKKNPELPNYNNETGSKSGISNSTPTPFPYSSLNFGSSHIPSPKTTFSRPCESSNGVSEQDSVNLEYLKHVVLKFITSREYEAVQLTRAVSTLLHMSPEEEALLRNTLEWKMSWFGARPDLGKGQLAKGILPHQ